MAAPVLPEDVAAHLRAAIHLSNMRVHYRLLDEAEKLIALNLPGSAIVMTGVVLETFLEGVPRERFAKIEEHIAQWRGWRNYTAHPDSPQPTIDQAIEMLREVRGLLGRDLRLSGNLQPEQTIPETPRQVRGKYRFVSTSSTAFIERKSEELRLEHQ